MDEFYRRLDEAEIKGRTERIFADRPDNLHEYQGCVNDPVHLRIAVLEAENARLDRYSKLEYRIEVQLRKDLEEMFTQRRMVEQERDSLKSALTTSRAHYGRAIVALAEMMKFARVAMDELADAKGERNYQPPDGEKEQG